MEREKMETKGNGREEKKVGQHLTRLNFQNWQSYIFRTCVVCCKKVCDVIIDSRNWTTLFKEGSGEVESVCGEAPLIIQIEVV